MNEVNIDELEDILISSNNEITETKKDDKALNRSIIKSNSEIETSEDAHIKEASPIETEIMCLQESSEEFSIEKLLMAATYVEDARIGRQSDFDSSTRKSLELYRYYYSPIGEMTVTILISFHLFLAVIEKPALQGFLAPLWVTTTLEMVILVAYTARVYHIKAFTPVNRFWSDTKNVVLILLIGVFILDVIVYVSLESTGVNTIRLSRPLRPLFAINFPEMRQVRRSFRNLRRTLPDVFNVLVLLFFSLAIFALMAFKLFENRDLYWIDGRRYFANYWDSLFDLYVLITTANNPDVMMPSFDLSAWYVLFFVVFLVLCYFIYMNIILAVIYNNYRRHLKNEVRTCVLSKRQRLSHAFDLIATEVNNKTEGIPKVGRPFEC